MQKLLSRCWFVMFLGMLLCCPAVASRATQAPPSDKLYCDVPRSNHAYKIFAKLVQAKIVYGPTICFPSSRGWKYDSEHRGITRYEFAVIIQRALAILEAKQRKHSLSASQYALLNEVRQLAHEFHAELAAIR